jgi:hypothetical protein
MAGLVAWRDVGRLLDVLWWQRTSIAQPLRLPMPKWLFVLGRLAKVAAVAWLLYGEGKSLVERWRVSRQPPSQLVGSYEFVELQRDGKVVPPLLTDATRWRYLFCETYGDGGQRVTFVQIAMMDGDVELAWPARIDEAAGTITLLSDPPRDAAGPAAGVIWRYRWDHVFPQRTGPDGVAAPDTAQPPERQLVLEGDYLGEAVCARLRQLRPEQFLVRKRGFHWIQEHPYHR